MTHDQLMTHARASALRILRGEDRREPMPTELGAAAARMIAALD